MKLVRFGPLVGEKPGILLAGERRDASALVSDYDHAFFQGSGVARLLREVDERSEELPLLPESER